MTAWEKILQKVLVGSNIDSSQWNSIQAGLRDRAFFSSKVAEMNILDAAQKISSEYAKGEKDLSKLRMELKDFIENKAGYAPADSIRGTIKDLTSKARLDVIVKTNVALARGFIQYAEGMTPGAFAAFPAQEFTRIEHRNQPRTTWPQRWKNAGGKFYAGRMIALKDDPVWTRLSIFGEPFPPFDWGSGMGVMDVSKKEAIELGIITEEELQSKREELRVAEQNKTLPSMNGNLQAEIPFKNDNAWQFAKKAFGDQVQVDKQTGTVKFFSEIFKENFDKGNFTFRLGESTEQLINKLPSSVSADTIRGKSLVVTQHYLNKKRENGIDHRDHYTTMPEYPEDIPLETRDIALLPSMWRNPSRVYDSHGRLVLELDAIDGSIYRAVVDIKKDPNLKTFYRTLEPYETQTPSS